MDFHTLIASGTYMAIFLFMIANGIINFPSSQVLYLIVGYFVSAEKLHFIPAIAVGALGNTLGNIIAFLLIKKYGHTLAHKILIMQESVFKKVHAALYETFSKRGLWWLFVGKLTPSVKAFIPVVAGLADTPTLLTSFLFLLASIVWAVAITYIGYTFGEHVSISSFLAVSFIIGASFIFVLYRNISKKLSEAQ